MALCIYVLALLPVFQLPYLAIERLVVERAAYLPSAGFCWLLAALLVRKSAIRNPHSAVIGRTAFLLIVLIAYTARSAVRMGDWRDELALFHEGLARTPAAPDLHLIHAQTLLRHNRPVEAIAALHEAMRLRQDYADANNYLGRAWALLQKPEFALLYYRRAAELFAKEGQPDFASRVWSNIGIAHRALGKNPEAIAAYGKSLQLDPMFPEARNNLGFALLLEGRTDEAIRELRTTIAIDPTSWQAHANLGLAYSMKRDWAAASAALAQAERLNSQNPEIQARIAEIHLARGELEEARRRFQHALQLSPQNGRALAGINALQQAGSKP